MQLSLQDLVYLTAILVSRERGDRVEEVMDEVNRRNADLDRISRRTEQVARRLARRLDRESEGESSSEDVEKEEEE